jgi:hypothetical protein
VQTAEQKEFAMEDKIKGNEGNCKKQQKTMRDIASCVLVSKAKKVYRCLQANGRDGPTRLLTGLKTISGRTWSNECGVRISCTSSSNFVLSFFFSFFF